jgi:hypothetical protein
MVLGEGKFSSHATSQLPSPELHRIFFAHSFAKLNCLIEMHTAERYLNTGPNASQTMMAGYVLTKVLTL